MYGLCTAGDMVFNHTIDLNYQVEWPLIHRTNKQAYKPFTLHTNERLYITCAKT